MSFEQVESGELAQYEGMSESNQANTEGKPSRQTLVLSANRKQAEDSVLFWQDGVAFCRDETTISCNSLVDLKAQFRKTFLLVKFAVQVPGSKSKRNFPVPSLTPSKVLPRFLLKK